MNFIQYIKQAWKAGTSGGTPLSPDRLNHMEDGIKNNNNMISELNNRIDNIGKVELNTVYGANNIKTLNIDMIENSIGYILCCQNNYLQGTPPTSVLGGNKFLLIGFSSMINQKPRFGVQLAIGFGSNKIAIRNAQYTESGGSWSAWRTI